MFVKDNYKKCAGVIYACILYSLFVLISIIGHDFFSGAEWYLYSSFFRLIFGCITILIIAKLYKRSLCEIFTNFSPKKALLSGLGFLIYWLYFIIVIILGYVPVKIVGLTVGLFISQIILQQITTGFWEEAIFRGLVLEGFFFTKKSKTTKLMYALISFILFGAIHVITGWDTYKFLYTGTIGFAFATVYLNTHNLVLPMVLHFLYDVLANMADYLKTNNSDLFYTVYGVNEIMIIAMFLISLIMLILKSSNAE